MEKLALRLETDFCLGCISTYPSRQPVLIGIPVEAGEDSYECVCIDLCPSCTKAQDYNKIKKTLRYWLMESITVKLD